METQIKQVMSAILGIAVEEIEDLTSPVTVDRWDSLRHMSLIVAVEDALGIQFPENQIPELLNFRLLCDAAAEARRGAAA